MTTGKGILALMQLIVSLSPHLTVPLYQRKKVLAAFSFDHRGDVNLKKTLK